MVGYKNSEIEGWEYANLKCLDVFQINSNSKGNRMKKNVCSLIIFCVVYAFDIRIVRTKRIASS